MQYFLNKRPNDAGEHLVLLSGCKLQPPDEFLIDLGDRDGFDEAVRQAEVRYPSVAVTKCEECTAADSEGR